MTVHTRTVEPQGFFAFLHKWLFDGEFQDGLSKQVDRWIALLIVSSVLAVVCETIPALYQTYGDAFRLFDLITVTIFSVEYVLRVATAHLEPEFAGKRFARLRYMFSFYALVDLIAIAPFYLASMTTLDVEMLRVLRLLRLMRIFKLSRQLVPAWHEFRELNAHRSFRAKVYALLEPTGHSGRLHAYVDNFIVFWIILSISCVVLETVASIQELFAQEFYIIDVMAFSIFTLEYIARVYTAPENPHFHRLRLPRWAHMRSGGAIIDLLAILPFLLESFLTQHLDLRFLRVFRLMRMLKLTRYTSALETLYKVLKREWQVIFASVFVMMLLVVLTASLGYLFEHPAQPDKFENIPQSIYWAVVTLASVGYGDISPVTPMGRFLTVVLALVGIGIFAIPAGLLASAFTDQLRIDRDEFKRSLMKAYEDGALDQKEKEIIIAEAERLHLSQDEVKRLTEEARAEFEFVTKAAEQERKSSGGAIIDAKAHPELAAVQFQLLVGQLALIAQAAGESAIRQGLQNNRDNTDTEEAVLSVIASAARR